MFELKTLGGLQLRGPRGRDYESVLAQPKRLALLAYLAIAHRGGYARRDTILALFWPELDDVHAHGALRQSCRFLRRSLGAAVLVNRGGGELGVEARALSCDAVAFDEACDAGELVVASELYRGALLEGLHVADASPDLERWIEDERSRLRRRASRAAWTVVDRTEADGNIELAAEFARRALALFPDDERGLRRVVSLLDRLADRDGAVRAYETFARRLAADFELEPGAETVALIAAVRARTHSGNGSGALPPSSAARALSIVAAPATHAPAGVTPPVTPTIAADVRVATEATAPRFRRWVGVMAAGVAAAGIAIAAYVSQPHGQPALQSNVIAVAPWRVSGADSSLGYLAEGMVDLLGATLTGEGGPRAVDPRTALAAWHRASSSGGPNPGQAEALRIARRLGADHLLLGEVVGSPARLTMNATLLSVASGSVRVRTTATGPGDSLTSIVDALAARLLVLESGEATHRLAAGTSTSLPALRAYLDGRAAYRRGRYRDAVEHFSLALERDSTFALAGWGMAAAAGWIGEYASDQRGLRVALTWQQRLSPRDRALVHAEAGHRHPAPGWVGDCLGDWGHAVALAPDQAEAWFWLGDCFYHTGALLSIGDARVRAQDAFGRSLELDSTVAGPLAHLIEMAARDSDRAAVRRLAGLYLAHDSTADEADYMRWRIAVALDDTTSLAGLRRRFGRVSLSSLLHILTFMQLDGVGLRDADAIAAALRQRPLSPQDRARTALALWDLALSRGRPHETVAAGRDWRAAGGPPSEYLARTIGVALFADGDTSAALQALRELRELSDQKAERNALAPGERQSAICARSVWDVLHGHVATTRAAIRELRSVTVARDTAGVAGRSAMCAATLEAILAATTRSGDATSALRRLDSLAAAGAVAFPVTWLGAENIIIARLLEARGDVRGALAVIRRRVYRGDATTFLASSLREEGRLAALAGDREGAIRAYRHYLALRSDPEPESRADVERIRTRVAALEHPGS